MGISKGYQVPEPWRQGRGEVPYSGLAGGTRGVGVLRVLLSLYPPLLYEFEG